MVRAFVRLLLLGLSAVAAAADRPGWSIGWSEFGPYGGYRVSLGRHHGASDRALTAYAPGWYAGLYGYGRWSDLCLLSRDGWRRDDRGSATSTVATAPSGPIQVVRATTRHRGERIATAIPTAFGALLGRLARSESTAIIAIIGIAAFLTIAGSAATMGTVVLRSV
jgi:hypothetical protein